MSEIDQSHTNRFCFPFVYVKPSIDGQSNSSRPIEAWWKGSVEGGVPYRNAIKTIERNMKLYYPKDVAAYAANGVTYILWCTRSKQPLKKDKRWHPQTDGLISLVPVDRNTTQWRPPEAVPGPAVDGPRDGTAVPTEGRECTDRS